MSRVGRNCSPVDKTCYDLHYYHSDCLRDVCAVRLVREVNKKRKKKKDHVVAPLKREIRRAK